MKRGAGKPRFSAGRWSVQRERAQIEDHYPPPLFHDAASIAQIVPSVLGRLGIEDQQWLTTLAATWKDVVGAPLARHTRPGRFEGRRLIVFVDNSAWLSELKRYGQDKLLANVRRQPGAGQVQVVQLLLDPEGAGSRAGDKSGPQAGAL
jgi:predicted nucleic acid-binding Zn ribbon protein